MYAGRQDQGHEECRSLHWESRHEGAGKLHDTCDEQMFS